MKMIKKIATAAAGLALVGSSVFAQSLADAKKAIGAEQYQKAKAMLKNLTVTQPDNGEAFFQLGWVYLSQEYVDSAKAVFSNGVAADAKSPLNHVGLGVSALLSGDEGAANASFKQAIDMTKKKDSEPFLYIGKGYLLGAVDGKLSAEKATAALDALNKAKERNEKDPEIYIEIGNAYRSQLNNSEAYKSYQEALARDPNSAAAQTAIGVLWKYADSWEAADQAFKNATTADPNYGPAYREWAETEHRQAELDRRVAVEKINSAVGHYKTYLNLTDQSDETLLRYADFLVRAGKWDEVQKVAAKLSSSAKINARAYRYLGYAAYENKDYPAAVSALRNWFSKADSKRILPRDHYYYGKTLLDSKQDTTQAVESLSKAIELDSTFTDVYRDISKVYLAQRRYKRAGDAYYALIRRKPDGLTLGDYNNLGRYYYFAFTVEQAAKAKADSTFVRDSTLLVKADSAFSYVESNLTKPLASVTVMRARIAELHEADRNNIQGLAKPFYEKVIEIAAADPANVAAADKAFVVEAYDYLGRYYGYKEKNDEKAIEYFTKAKELDPKDTYLDYYMQQKKAATKSK